MTDRRSWPLWILTRIANAIVVVWLSVTAVFIVVALIPGDPVEAALGGPGSQASEEAVEAMRRDLGLDQPLVVQYLSQLARLATLDLGNSYAQRIPVTDVIAGALPSTLILAVVSLGVGWLLALALTMTAALGGRVARGISSMIGIVSASLPHFWLGLVLVAIFATGLGWFPAVSGSTLNSLVLPVMTLAIPLAGFLAQTMITGIREAEAKAFSLSARARGESRRGLLHHHTLRHAVLPAVALTSWAAGSLIGGAVVVEIVFARPGIGRALVSAVVVRDAPVLTGIIAVSAIVFVLLGILGDTASRLIDPRGRSVS